MKSIAKLLMVAAVAMLFIAPSAAAHGRAIVVEGAAERCYIYTNDLSDPEFWIESNGHTKGGADSGTPADHFLGLEGEGSGLQRGESNGRAGDEQVTAEEWAARCIL